MSGDRPDGPESVAEGVGELDVDPDPGREATSRTWRARLRSLAGKLALAAVATALSLLLAEGAIRVVMPQQLIALRRGDVWMAVDTLGWRHRPNADAMLNVGEGEVHFLTDGQGFRIGEVGRSEGVPSILLLGDSFLEAIQVSYEESVAGLLEASLAGAFGHPVAVRNTGVGGWDPNHYLILARGLLRTECHEAVVVFLFAGNDVINGRTDAYPRRESMEDRRRPLRWPHSLSKGELIDAVAYPINDFLEARSHLFVLAKNSAGTLLMRVGLSAYNLPNVIAISQEDSGRWDNTAAIAADLNELVESVGARAFFVLVPASYQADPEILDQYLWGFNVDPATVDMDQPGRKLGEAFRTRGLDLLDVLPDFRAATAAGEHLYGDVDRHLSPQGHRRLEAAVRPILLEGLESVAPPACRLAERSDAEGETEGGGPP